MNPELSRDLVQQHIRDIWREARQCAAPAQPPAARADRAVTRPALRSRIGFVLVETGLRLLADSSVTARPELD